MLDFKSLRKAEALVTRVRNGEAGDALIVGHGFIGVELALMLTDLGVEVTIVGRRPWIMPRVLDRPTSECRPPGARKPGGRAATRNAGRGIRGDSRREPRCASPAARCCMPTWWWRPRA